MTKHRIHAGAVVDPAAELGDGFEAGPFAVVEAGVRTGVNCRLAAGAILRAGTVLGDGVRIDSHAVLGGDPQSLTFDPSVESGVRVGDGVCVREGVTINRATSPGGETVIGSGCYLMAQSHVGHDCRLGEGVVVCNAVLLAGHVTVGDRAFLGGDAAVHQFCRIGEGAMVGGKAVVSLDVPPFVTTADRNRACGLNLVGLRRHGCSREAVADLKRCYQAVLQGPGDPARRAAAAAADGLGATPEGARFLGFFQERGRGFVRSDREGGR